MVRSLLETLFQLLSGCDFGTAWRNWPRKYTKTSPAVVAAMPGGVGGDELIRAWTQRRHIPCQTREHGGELWEALCSSWPDGPWADPAPSQT